MWDLSKAELPSIAFCEIGSVSESNAVLFVKQQEEDFTAHNVEHLTRVYPSGKRYDSSNLHVFPLWRAGVHTLLHFFHRCGGVFPWPGMDRDALCREADMLRAVIDAPLYFSGPTT